jgi:hypothetical protein
MLVSAFAEVVSLGAVLPQLPQNGQGAMNKLFILRDMRKLRMLL